MVQLVENTVVDWIFPDTDIRQIERILWVSPSKDMLFSIALQDDKAFPNLKSYQEYETAIANGLCRIIEWVNENIPLLDAEIKNDHLELRDKSWDAIKDIVLDEPACFDKAYRGSRIREVQERTGLHKSTLYRYLRRYWQGGKIKNALLPHFNNCGSYGNEREPKEAKRGRPRKFESEAVGINIDEETKQL